MKFSDDFGGKILDQQREDDKRSALSNLGNGEVPSKEARCNCGNPARGFDCVCQWVREHQGQIVYSCEHCGLYKASRPRCSHCERG